MESLSEDDVHSGVVTDSASHADGAHLDVVTAHDMDSVSQVSYASHSSATSSARLRESRGGG